MTTSLVHARCLTRGGTHSSLSFLTGKTPPSHVAVKLAKPIRRSSTRGVVRCVIEKPLTAGAPPPNQQLLLLDSGKGEWFPAAWSTVTDIWSTADTLYGDRLALYEPHRNPPVKMMYSELVENIKLFGEGMKQLQVKQGDVVGLLSDNSHRWIIADQGIMMAGAVDAVRGAKATTAELVNIAAHSECIGLVLETDELLQKLLPELLASDSIRSRVRFIVTLWGRNGATSAGNSRPSLHNAQDVWCPVLSYEDVIAMGKRQNGQPRTHVKLQPQDPATIVYTSGTTGNPKGVRLTHANLVHQIIHIDSIIKLGPTDTVLSLLPPWHMYERSGEYFVLSRGAQLTYATVKTFREDLAVYPSDYFFAVPLIFNVLYTGIQKKLDAASKTRAAIARTLISLSQLHLDQVRVLAGKSLRFSRAATTPTQLHPLAHRVLVTLLWVLTLPFHKLAQRLVYSKVKAAIGIRKAAITGGGSLPPYIDRFFEALGIVLLNGYGLTETSPVLTARTSNSNVLGTVGRALPGTDIKVVHPEEGTVLPPGTKGLVKVRGPQVMAGYHRDEVATRSSLDDDGWFSTGDLGWIVPRSGHFAASSCEGHLVIEGRSKDTIVLASGENVEPSGIEEAVSRCELVQQIMLVGQDERRLGALIVPNKDALKPLVEARLKKLSASQSSTSPSTTSPSESKERKEQDASESNLEHVLIHQAVRKIMKSGFAPHEQIWRFKIVEEPFSVDNGLLTPTMKMRRELIARKYEKDIEVIYESQEKQY